jgi:CheY-like chemotaxis protein
MKIHKILMVDEDVDFRKIVELTLQAVEQWTVTSAASGREAIELATRDPPDVILLDVMMPGMDGPTTLRRLRENPATAQIPVIFVTAKVQKHEVKRYLSIGAAGVIRKPFDPLTLPDEVRRILGG